MLRPVPKPLPSGPLAACAALALVVTAGCGGPSDPDLPDQGQIGQTLLKPGADDVFAGGSYIVDPHGGGVDTDVFIEELFWGRLVDVYDTEEATGANRLVHKELVIAQNVNTELGRWQLVTDAATQINRLIIEEENTEETQDAFDLAVAEVQLDADGVAPKSTNPAEAPPFSLVARNSSLVVRFSDLMDADTVILNETVQLFVGAPSVVPFEARLFMDENHGGISANGAEFASTRLIIDFTVSATEQAALPSPLAANGSGLPESDVPIDSSGQPANVALRVPTVLFPSVGQFEVLRNLAGKPLTTEDNGPVDLGAFTQDVVRAFRSGNSADPSNGFLMDFEQPRIVGSQPIDVASVANDPAGTLNRDLVLNIEFGTAECAFDPVPGDVLRISQGLDLIVTQPALTSAGAVNGLRVSVPPLVEVADIQTLLGSARYRTPWRAELAGSGLEPCFVQFNPTPSFGASAGIQPGASLIVEFSEPMDPLSGRPFDSMSITKEEQPETFNDWIVGEVRPNPDLSKLTLTPSLPLPNGPGSTADLWVVLNSIAPGGGLRDLSGQALEAELPAFPFTLDPTADPNASQNFSLRFSDPDEAFVGSAGAGMNGPDFRGQFFADPLDQSIRPRPLTRFSAIVDEVESPLVAAMTSVPTGLQTPLSSLGSKLHAIWRYADLGFSISNFEDLNTNIDVEAIAFAPQGSSVVPAMYPQFEMRLGHSARMPDEILLGAPLSPIYPNSGFFANATYEDNYLDVSGGSSFTVVHPRPQGFQLSNLEVFLAANLTPMVYMPMNRGKPQEDFTYFTFRDTGIQQRGAFSEASSGVSDPPFGIPFHQEVGILNILSPEGEDGQIGAEDPIFGGPPPVFDPDGDGESDVGWAWGNFGLGRPPGFPTVGLPLLMEFRCYPTENVSLNNLRASLAAPNFTRPSFRAFSTGGYDLVGQEITKDPDAQPLPTGGLNTNPLAGQIGAMTAPRDSTVYLGQADFVVRVSRVFSQVFEPAPLVAEDPHDFEVVVVEPRPENQPTGTAVELAYRGITTRPAATSPFTDATLLDIYGDVREDRAPDHLLPPAKMPWSSSLDSLDGSAGFQLRLTFISNPISGLTPSLTSIGVASRLP